MTFDDILAQVLALLKRQGRVSYGALKRRFDLDDDYLNDVKDEILFTSPQIVDEGGRGLVWVGETGTPPAPPHLTPQTQSTHVASPPTVPHTLYLRVSLPNTARLGSECSSAGITSR